MEEDENRVRWNVRKSFGVRHDVGLSIVAVAVTTLLFVKLIKCPNNETLRMLGLAGWALWAMGPPSFFLMEWTSFEGEVHGPEFEAMKYSHELASKFWIGGVGVISAILIAVYDNKFDVSACCG